MCSFYYAHTQPESYLIYGLSSPVQFLIMRTLGWWDYRVDQHPFEPVRTTKWLREAEYPANSSARLDGGTLSRSIAVAVPVFPPSVRVLVLRGAAELNLGRGGSFTPKQWLAASARWVLAALAVGRRLVSDGIALPLKYSLLVHPEPLSPLSPMFFVSSHEHFYCMRLSGA